MHNNNWSKKWLKFEGPNVTFLESARANQKVLIAPIFCEIHKFKCGDPIEKKVKEAYNLELNVAFGKLNVTFNKSQVI